MGEIWRLIEYGPASGEVNMAVDAALREKAGDLEPAGDAAGGGLVRPRGCGRQRTPRVNYCHRHNLVVPGTAGTKRSYGIRVSLPDDDTMIKILGDNWEQLL